jgi:hypothetical protein
MKRREFLDTISPAVLFAGMIGAGVLSKANGEEYQPVGYLDPETEGSEDVDYVTVNGERVDHVFALNDVAGWVKHYGDNFEVVDSRGVPRLRTFHREGVVRVHWRKV